MDQTLVHTRELNPDESFGRLVEFDHMGEKRRFGSLLRPSAIEFLDHLAEQGYQLCVMTAGGTRFQKRILRTHGILAFFDHIFGRDLFDTPTHSVATPENWVLVDDLAAGTLGFFDKMSWLGVKAQCTYSHKLDSYLETVVERHYIQCTPFLADDPDHQPLTQLRDLVIEKLAKQSASTVAL